MTAEEKLKKLYKACEPELPVLNKDGSATVRVNSGGGIFVAPEHIDLIANLVVERLLKIEPEDEE